MADGRWDLSSARGAVERGKEAYLKYEKCAGSGQSSCLQADNVFEPTQLTPRKGPIGKGSEEPAGLDGAHEI